MFRMQHVQHAVTPASVAHPVLIVPSAIPRATIDPSLIKRLAYVMLAIMTIRFRLYVNPALKIFPIAMIVFITPLTYQEEALCSMDALDARMVTFYLAILACN